VVFAALSKERERVIRLLKETGFEVQFVYEDFKERDSDKALVILAKKVFHHNQPG